MRVLVRVGITAVREVHTIRTHLEKRSPGLGHRFQVELTECLAVLAERPQTWQVRHGTYRYAALAKLRYLVIYEWREREVVVYHVRHMHRRPMKRFFGR